MEMAVNLYSPLYHMLSATHILENVDSNINIFNIKYFQALHHIDYPDYNNR